MEACQLRIKYTRCIDLFSTADQILPGLNGSFSSCVTSLLSLKCQYESRLSPRLANNHGCYSVNRCVDMAVVYDFHLSIQSVKLYYMLGVVVAQAVMLVVEIVMMVRGPFLCSSSIRPPSTLSYSLRALRSEYCSEICLCGSDGW